MFFQKSTRSVHFVGQRAQAKSKDEADQFVLEIEHLEKRCDGLVS